MTLKKQKVNITQPDAIKFMSQLLEGKLEHELCPHTLQRVLEQHHNVYLRYVSMRDRKK